MHKILMMLAAAALALPLNAAQPAKKTAKVKKQNKKEVKASKKWDHEQVVELITKVNNYWQANNKPEVRAKARVPPCSVIPFKAAAMPNSRTPNRRLRPNGLSAEIGRAHV